MAKTLQDISYQYSQKMMTSENIVPFSFKDIDDLIKETAQATYDAIKLEYPVCFCHQGGGYAVCCEECKKSGCLTAKKLKAEQEEKFKKLME